VAVVSVPSPGGRGQLSAFNESWWVRGYNKL